MSVPRRPGRGETDEDLLKQQEEFLAKKETSSVKIVKKSDTSPRVVNNEANLNHSLEGSGDIPQNIPVRSTASLDELTSQKNNSFGNDTVPTPSWISNPNSGIGTMPLLATTTSNSDASAANPGPVKKKSLFAMRMEKSRNIEKIAESPIAKGDMSKSQSKFGEHSYIVSGKEAAEIHKQNVAQLEKLSVQEIEEERQKLMSQLGSSTIKFLQERRRANQNLVSDTDHIKLAKSIAMKSTSQTAIKLSVHDDTASPSSEPQTNFTKQTAKAGERKKVFSNSLTSQQNKSDTKPEEEDLLATLPINPNEAKQWLHMDVLEKDKFEWMRDLPPVKADPGPEEPYSARFDFEGLLLPYNDEKLDVNRGLHHHGDEPERPGYTLQELMQLSRSSVQQQRIMGLNTIGNILLKAKLGIYDNVLQQNILKELLDAGIFLLLRFSMDDLSPAVVFTALSAMRNLLFSEPDEASLDYYLGCEGSLQQPLLDVPYEDNDAKKIQEQKEQEAELKDFEIIQLDVLRGAERTNLIVRLGYILDVLKGPPDVVVDVLLRIARHSRVLAETIVSCGGLLRTVRDQLLTSHVVSSLAAGFGQPGYGEPSSKALRLMRVLAAHSRTIANTLLDKFNIMEPVMTYVSMSSPELPQIQGLVIHGYYLWQTLMSYGLASQSILDLFPILMRQLHFHVQLTSAVGEEATPSGHELATALIGVIEKACYIISSDRNILEPKPIFQLAKLVADCLRKWLTQLSLYTSEKPLWSCTKMVGSAFNCLAAVANCAKDQDSMESKSILEKIENLTYDAVIPFLSSPCLQTLLENLIPSSHFLNTEEAGTKRDPANLPSLGAMQWGGESLSPCLLPEAPHPLFSGLLRFIATFYGVIGSSSNKLQSLLLDSVALERYIEALVVKPLRSSNHWFCRQEVYMLHHLIALIVLQPALVPPKNKVMYSQLALRLVDLIQANDKHLITSLLPSTVFSSEFMRWGMDSVPLETKDNDLIEECLKRLPVTGSLYLDMLGVRFSKVPSPSQRISLTSLSKGTDPALPVDWPFAPLLLFYGQYNAQNRSRCSEQHTIEMVTDTLKFLYLTETLWPKSRRPLSVTARWCRLALVFLAGSDLFLDENVSRYLKKNLDQLLLQRTKLDFSEKIPGLSSFYDLYGELLLQFAAVSYGDELFGAFLLLPLQQRQDPQLRRMVWGENAVVLRSLSTPICKVGVPLEEYLEPCERDTSLLSAYVVSIARGHVNERRCPVLYRVAVHHVATFTSLHKDHPFAISLQKQIDNLGNKKIQDLFLKYPASLQQT